MKQYDLTEIADDLNRLQKMDNGAEREKLLVKVLPVLSELINTMARIADKISEPAEPQRSPSSVATKRAN